MNAAKLSRLGFWTAIQLAAVAALFFCSCPLAAHAQLAGTASIQGTVTDPTGAVIPGVTVVLTENATRVQRTVTSDSSGLYIYPNIPIGTYTLSASQPGFETFTQSNIVLEVGSSISINVKMTLGSTSQRIEVKSQGLALQTEDPSFKQTIDQQTVVEMPLNGRQMTNLITLSGGTAPAPGGDFTGSKYSYQTIAISIGGGMGNTTMWRLDGGDNNDYMANGNLPFPFPDAVNEFSVESTALSAQNGMHTGGMVNVVTRSGTNTYHGEAFEFIRNNFIDATNFFSTSKDTLHQNQFGGTFGGPISFHPNAGDHKLFGFAAYQRTHADSASALTKATVPTAANLQGDFSETDGPNCVSGAKTIPLVDPLTGVALTGNKYPSSPSYNAQALELQGYLPPDVSSYDPLECGFVSYAIPSLTSDNQFVTRVDYTISEKDHLYGRYFIDGYQAPAFYSPTNILITTQSGNEERVQSLTLGDAYSFSARTVNSAHITLMRRRNDRGYASDAINITPIGVDLYQIAPNGIELSEGKFTIGGGTNSSSQFNDNTLSLDDDVTMLRGKNQFVFGGGWVQNQLNISNAYEGNGEFTFNGEYSGSGPHGGNVIGDQNLDFLWGALSAFQQSKEQQNALRAPIPNLYVEDTYHATSRVTLVGGLRWSPNFMPVDVFNRGVVFNESDFLANKISSVYPNAPAGALYYGDPGVPRQFTQSSPWQFAPNAGVSWDPTGSGKTIFRGGAEMAYDMVNFFTGQRNQQNPPFATAISQTQTSTSPPISFSSPWSVGQFTTSPFPIPEIPPSDTAFFAQSQYIVLPPHFHPSYTEQWTTSIQHEFPQGWQMQVMYMGSHTVHAPIGLPISPAVFVPGVWGAGGTGCTGVVLTGPAGKPAGAAGTACSTTSNESQRFLLTMLNPTQGNQYEGGGGGSVLVDDTAMANYNALVTSMQHRLSSTFSLLSNWTWSRCMDIEDAQGDLSSTSVENPNNPAMDYGPCGSDYRDIENVVLVAKSNFTTLPRFAALLVNNWEFAPLIHIQSGPVVNVTAGQDNSYTDVGNDRPNLIAGVPIYLHTTFRAGTSQADRGYLNPAAFATVCPSSPTPTPLNCAGYGAYGNISKNSFRAPPSLQFDGQVTRIFPIHERLNMTFRLEAFNVPNHPDFGSPNAGVTSSTFGQISSTSNNARVFQGVVKFIF